MKRRDPQRAKTLQGLLKALEMGDVESGLVLADGLAEEGYQRLAADLSRFLQYPYFSQRQQATIDHKFWRDLKTRVNQALLRIKRSEPARTEYGTSPPHGIFTKGTTMAYVKARSRETGSPYFDRETSRFFGREQFWGPYVGPGGVFFVQRNRGGVSVKEVTPNWNIRTYPVPPTLWRPKSIRHVAQLLAKGEFHPETER